MNLQTLKAEKEKVEKGCVKCLINISIRHDLIKNKTIEKRKLKLCPTCQARLEALNLGIQAVENQIKDEIKWLRRFKKDIENAGSIYEADMGVEQRLSQLQKETP